MKVDHAASTVSVRLLDEAVEESKAVVDGITFYEQGQELLDADRGSGKSMVYLLDIEKSNEARTRYFGNP